MPRAIRRAAPEVDLGLRQHEGFPNHAPGRSHVDAGVLSTEDAE
jgi:hypothetical protein